jgi:riboflavin biosynthesis pyrimidine reductase
VHSLFPTSPAELTADDLVELYAYPAEQRWVRANFVSSVDGAAQGSDKRSGTLSGSADQKVFSLLRSLADVIVVGAGTARTEGYLPVQPHEVDGDLRADHGLTSVPAIAVASRSLDIDHQLLAGGAAPTIVLTSDRAPADRLEAAMEQTEVIVVSGDEIDFRAAFEALSGMGLHRILCEGGPSLMHELCATHVVDELCLTLAPVITAGQRLRIAEGPDLVPPCGLQLRHVLESDGTLFLRYLLDRPAAPPTRLA